MQNRYTGDIGDYVKYALLRALIKGHRLGVAWYLFPNESHNADGRHIEYLQEFRCWRDHDPELFDTLKRIVTENKRKVSEVEASAILGAARYSREVLDHSTRMSTQYQQRCAWRSDWFDRVQAVLRDCDVVFADPDNGLCEDDKFKPGTKDQWKRLPLSEAKALAEGRAAIIYHHNARTRGTHEQEIAYWIHQLGADTLALYWHGPGSCSNRTFFVINPESGMVDCLREFKRKWQQIALITKDTAPSFIN